MYVSSEDGIYDIDGFTGEFVIIKKGSPFHSGGGVDVNPGTNSLYTTCFDSEVLRVIDTDSRLMTDNKQIAKKLNDELKIETRKILDYLHTMVTILIIDRRYTLTIELKDDTKTSSYDAIGLAAYSTNKSLSISYVSIFESIWKQAELYAKIKTLENQVRVQKNVEKSYLVAVARALKVPLKPMTTLAEIIRSKDLDRGKQVEFIDSIIKNAQEIKDIVDRMVI